MSNAIEKLTQAKKWLASAKTLDDLRQIHDIAVAADALGRFYPFWQREWSER